MRYFCSKKWEMYSNYSSQTQTPRNSRLIYLGAEGEFAAQPNITFRTSDFLIEGKRVMHLV